MNTSLRFALFLACVAHCSAQNITTGLVAHFEFNGNASDRSGSNNQAMPAGVFQYVSDGRIDGAIRISGDRSLFFSGGGHVVLPAFGSAMNAGFTFSFWVKDELPGVGASHEEAYLSYGILDQPAFSILLNGELRQVMYSISGGAGSVSRTITKPLNFSSDLPAWKHIALTYTPGKVAAYFNGLKVGEEFITVNVFPVTRAALGRHWWSGGAASSARMSATFDNVRIYNRALSEDDVRQLYVTDSVPAAPLPTIVSQPISQIVLADQSTTFRVVVASSTPMRLQWRRNGLAIEGALEASFTIPSVKIQDAGAYSVVVSNSVGSVTSGDAVLTVVPSNPGQLINISTLGSGAFTTGFVVGGSNARQVLVRAVGPTLGTFGVASPASQVSLTLYSGSTLLMSNSGWNSGPQATQVANAAAAVGAFALPSGSADAALLVSLLPGSYSAQVTANGSVLLEAYAVP